MKKKTLIAIIIGTVLVLGGTVAFLSYTENDGHWCAPGTQWGLGYSEAGLSEAEIEARSRCLDNNLSY